MKSLSITRKGIRNQIQILLDVSQKRFLPQLVFLRSHWDRRT